MYISIKMCNPLLNLSLSLSLFVSPLPPSPSLFSLLAFYLSPPSLSLSLSSPPSLHISDGSLVNK